MRKLATAAVALTCLLAAGSTGAKTQRQCEQWAGWSSGNDTRVYLRLRLCHSAKGVGGTARWDSKLSGWNVRRVVGRYSSNGKQLWLRDIRIIKQKPINGWRFCLIDNYSLRRVGADRLEGTYYSAACKDRATLRLRRVKTAKKADKQ